MVPASLAPLSRGWIGTVGTIGIMIMRRRGTTLGRALAILGDGLPSSRFVFAQQVDQRGCYVGRRIILLEESIEQFVVPFVFALLQRLPQRFGKSGGALAFHFFGGRNLGAGCGSW